MARSHPQVSPKQTSHGFLGISFKKCGHIQGVIVFDNVDHYVDVDQSLFASAVSAFVNEALRVEHQLVVIFTCRPRISYASVRFREIYLRGLDANEALLLFDTKIPGGLKEGKKQTVLQYT